MELWRVTRVRGLLAFWFVQLGNFHLCKSTLLLPENCPMEKKSRKNKSENWGNRPESITYFPLDLLSSVPGILCFPSTFNHESVFDLVAIKFPGSASCPRGRLHRLVETCFCEKCLHGWVASIKKCPRSDLVLSVVPSEDPCVSSMAARRVSRAREKLTGCAGCPELTSVPAPLIPWQSCPTSVCPKESVR